MANFDAYIKVPHVEHMLGWRMYLIFNARPAVFKETFASSAIHK
jgi:hypothetical protein